MSHQAHRRQLDKWEVALDEGFQSLSCSIRPRFGLKSIHNVDSINTALLGIDLYAQNVIVDGHHPDYVYAHLMSEHTYIP